ncbi:MAG: hypothetical protein R3F61_03180 [Myxococcota bacterium]
MSWSRSLCPRTPWIGALAALMLGTPALAGVSASSEAKTADATHPASAAVDGLLSTAWAEGDEGDGTGAWLELKLDRLTDVSSVSVWPGRFDQGSRGLREYGRPHTITVTLSGGGEDVTQQVRVLDIADTGPTRIDIPITGKAKAVRITLDQVYAGGIHNDTYITEVAVNYVAGAGHPSLEKLVEWAASKAGQEGAAKHTEEVGEAKAAFAGQDFGDRDAMAELKSAASDGAPYLRDRVAKTVADGYRMLAIPPSQDALNALLELEDPNAIAALELAATRARGDLQTALRDRVSRFRALQDLKGGGKRNVKPNGETGFCKGCLQSFGEPLGVAVDGFGGVWVADLGNHRVQRFDFSGISQATIGGGEPGISNAWLATTRDWYAAGNTAGTTDGSFSLPLDLDVVPDKKNGDGVVVLDAAGRVSLVGGNGAVTKSWSLGVTEPVSPGVGGEAHIAVAGKKIVAVWGNEAFVYDLEGAELSKFEIEDGVANGIVGFKNGKVAFLFDEGLVLYSTDGFRHGELLGDTVPDGYEYYDVFTDEKGKLWVVTDHGFAIKYKKPGTVDYQVEFVEYSLTVPRADAYQDVLFITDRDSFLKVDALEKKAQAEQAGK